MIPILYPADDSTAEKRLMFNTHGLGDLVDCIECKAKATNEGEYEMSFTYPIGGALFSELTENRIVKAKVNDYDDPQLFRIYSLEKEIDGKMTVNCQHISYDLSSVPVAAFKKYTPSGSTQQKDIELASEAVGAMVNNSLWTNSSNRFTISATGYSSVDKPNTEDGKYKVETPGSMRAILLDGDDSIRGSFGGDLVLDNYNITLKKTAGTNRGVKLEYGVDITDLSVEHNISEMVTGIVPYWKGSEDQENTSYSSDEEEEEEELVSDDSEEPVADVTLTWEQGDMYISNGQPSEGASDPATNRIRSNVFITMTSLSDIKSIKINGGYKYCIFCWYDSEYLGVWVNSQMTTNIANPFNIQTVDMEQLRAFRTGTGNTKQVTRIKFVVAQFANGTIGVSEGSNLVLSTDAPTPSGGEGYKTVDSITYGSIVLASSETGATYSRQNIELVDLSEFFETKPGPDQLNNKAVEWIKAERIGYPELDVTVNYAKLGQDVRLFDEITVYFPRMGIDVKAKVTSYEYDVLAEKCTEIEVSNANYSSKWKGLEDASRLKRGLIPPKRIGSGSITGGQIASGSIGSANLGAEAVTKTKVAKDAVTSYALKNGEISPIKFNISPGTVAKLESMGLDNFFANTIIALDIIAKNITAQQGLISQLNATYITAHGIHVSDHINVPSGNGEATLRWTPTFELEDIYGARWQFSAYGAYWHP